MHISVRLVIPLLALAIAACGPGGQVDPVVAPPPIGVQGITQLDRLAADQRAFDGQEVTVLGSIVEIGGSAVLCSALAEVKPDGCAGPPLALVGAIPPEMVGLTVTIRGIFHAERGPAAMTLAILDIRPAGA